MFLSAVWFGTVFCYYGIVLLGTELIAADTNCIEGIKIESSDACSAGCKTLEQHDYAMLLLTTSSELPTLLVIAVLADSIGRLKTMSTNFSILIICLFLLCWCLPGYLMVLALYLGRGVMAAQLQLSYLYTSEVYPTSIRGLGLGLCSSIARLGAISTPAVAHIYASYNLLGSLCVYLGVAVLSCLCSFCLPIETKNRPLTNFKES